MADHRGEDLAVFTLQNTVYWRDELPPAEVTVAETQLKEGSCARASRRRFAHP